MAKKVNLNFKLEKIDKEKFENVCKELGVSTNTAYIILINKMIRENRLPFDVSLPIDYKRRFVIINNEGEKDRRNYD